MKVCKMKLVVLDSTDATCYIYHLKIAFQDSIAEDFVAERHSLDNVQWMIVKEVEEINIVNP